MKSCPPSAVLKHVVVPFEAFGGAWDVSDSVLHGQYIAGSGPNMVVGALEPFAEGSVYVELRFSERPANSNAGLVVRLSNAVVTGADTFDGYAMSIRPDLNKLMITQHQTVGMGTWQLLAEYSLGASQTNGWP